MVQVTYYFCRIMENIRQSLITFFLALWNFEKLYNSRRGVQIKKPAKDESKQINFIFKLLACLICTWAHPSGFLMVKSALHPTRRNQVVIERAYFTCAIDRAVRVNKS